MVLNRRVITGFYHDSKMQVIIAFNLRFYAVGCVGKDPLLEKVRYSMSNFFLKKFNIIYYQICSRRLPIHNSSD